MTVRGEVRVPLLAAAAWIRRPCSMMWIRLVVVDTVHHIASQHDDDDVHERWNMRRSQPHRRSMLPSRQQRAMLLRQEAGLCPGHGKAKSRCIEHIGSSITYRIHPYSASYASPMSSITRYGMLRAHLAHTRTYRQLLFRICTSCMHYLVCGDCEREYCCYARHECVSSTPYIYTHTEHIETRTSIDRHERSMPSSLIIHVYIRLSLFSHRGILYIGPRRHDAASAYVYTYIDRGAHSSLCVSTHTYLHRECMYTIT